MRRGPGACWHPSHVPRGIHQARHDRPIPAGRFRRLDTDDTLVYLDTQPQRDTRPVTTAAFVVVSGLPGSGKSTLARCLARHLDLPVIDKDVILESLFDSLGVGDEAWRHRLSQASDDILFALAADASRAILDNWWHHDTAPGRLTSLADLLIEVHCDCDAALAAERFRTRTRHPGHLDPQLTSAQVAERVAAIRATYTGPLRLGGPLLTLDTSHHVDTLEIAKTVAQILTASSEPEHRNGQLRALWQTELLPDEQGFLAVRGMIAKG
ncbi:AAA family ATPase [Streptomyces sp. NPDC004752]